MIRENASLTFEVQDLMTRNVALQKAFANFGKTVSHVENVIEIFLEF